MKKHALAFLIGLAFIVNTVNVARTLPPFESADEAPHFLYMHHLAETGELPIIVPRGELVTLDRVNTWALESHQPPLYYAMGALLIGLTDRADLADYLRPNSVIFTMDIVEQNANVWLHAPTYPGDTGLALALVRGFSSLLGLGTLGLIYATAYIFSRRVSMAALSMAFVSVLPTFVGISAGVNNDNLVTFLYAAGVFVVVKSWRMGRLSWKDSAALALILPAAALSKLTGASLYGVVFFGLGMAAWRGDLPRDQVIRTLLLTLISGAVLAGWWYVRNGSLYGDFLALRATQSLWGREFEIAPTSGDFGAELFRIYRTFWMVVGHLHQPVYGADWLYVYGGLWSLVGLAGLVRGSRRAERLSHDLARFFAFVCAVIFALLLFGTRSVDISYGRLLYPALIGFAPLVIAGWAGFFGKRPVIIAASLIPFALATLSWWTVVLPTAYPTLQAVDALPDDAPFIGANAEGLDLLAYRVQPEQVAPGDSLTFDLYFRGLSTRNDSLIVTAVDALTLEQLGTAQVFPGMAPTDTLDPAQIYRARVRIPLDDLPAPERPRRVNVRIAWFSPSSFDFAALTDGAGNPISTLILSGALYIDPRYESPAPAQRMDVLFGDAIRLEGVTLPAATTYQPGERLPIALHWRTEKALTGNWRYTVQLFDGDYRLIDQQDGVIVGYPSDLWMADMAFSDTVTLHIPRTVPPGDFRVLVGWYQVTESGFQRLTPSGAGNFSANLAILPSRLAVRRLCTADGQDCAEE